EGVLHSCRRTVWEEETADTWHVGPVFDRCHKEVRRCGNLTLAERDEPDEGSSSVLKSAKRAVVTAVNASEAGDWLLRKRHEQPSNSQDAVPAAFFAPRRFGCSI